MNTELKEQATGHTPGPWSVSGDFTTSGLIESDFGIIATVAGYHAPDDETLPNAALIAAAPNLLLAASLLGGGDLYLEDFGRYCFCGCCRIDLKGSVTGPFHLTSCDMLNAAIMEAKGAKVLPAAAAKEEPVIPPAPVKTIPRHKKIELLEGYVGRGLMAHMNVRRKGQGELLADYGGEPYFYLNGNLDLRAFERIMAKINREGLKKGRVVVFCEGFELYQSESIRFLRACDVRRNLGMEAVS